MNYLRLITFFILAHIFLTQCSSTNYITKPSPLPENYYYDTDKFTLFKNPGTVDDYINTYTEWRKNNLNSSLLYSYSDIFKLNPDSIKKNVDVNGSNEEEFFAISKKPILLYSEPPQIPKSAAIQKESRLIVVSILVEKNGEVAVANLFDISDDINKKPSHDKTGLSNINKEILSKADKDMIYESLISAINFKFSPAEQKDKKVRVIMNVPLKFSF